MLNSAYWFYLTIKIFRLKLYSKEVERKKKTKTMISALGQYESLINLNHRLNTKDYKQIKVVTTFIMGKENFQVRATISKFYEES